MFFRMPAKRHIVLNDWDINRKTGDGIIPQTKHFSEKPFQRWLKCCGNRCTLDVFDIKILFLIKDC